MRLRYEDLIADPQAAVRRILAMVGMEDAQLPFVSGGELITSVNHSVAGNPDRLRHGLIRLRPDDRWRTGDASRDQRLVSALTLPLLLHYGYSLRTQGRNSARRRDDLRPGAARRRRATGRLTRRVRRHVRWVRTEGWARIVEEDELNPVTRIRVASTKRRLAQVPSSEAGNCHARVSRGAAAFGDEHARARARHRAGIRGSQRERPCRRSTTTCSGATRRSAASSWPASINSCSSSRCATRIASTTCSTRSTRRLPGAPSGHTGTSTAAPGRPCRSSAATTCWSSRTSPRAAAPGCGRRATLRSDARTDPQLRLHDDDAGNGGGAVLVGSQRSLLRPRTRSPRRRAAHLVPGPARDAV